MEAVNDWKLVIIRCGWSRYIYSLCVFGFTCRVIQPGCARFLEFLTIFPWTQRNWEFRCQKIVNSKISFATSHSFHLSSLCIANSQHCAGVFSKPTTKHKIKSSWNWVFDCEMKKNYRAQTPENLALTKILQKFRKTSTPQCNILIHPHFPVHMWLE